MLKKLLLPFLFIAFFASTAFAQTGSITGTVTNEDGEPVPTANVLLVGTDRGDATNLQGEYAIENVAAGTYTMRVTFIGYDTYKEEVTIRAGATTVKDVVLQRGAVGLEELVITGYGVTPKADRTSAVATVEVEEIEDVPIAGTGEILYGRAAGVQISSVSGQPGAGFQVRVRGAVSFNAGSRPLWIVDGVQISFSERPDGGQTSPLNFIDPDNIASFEVLKGAAATAIYGASGSNGVVLITTKTGTPGATQITASVSRGVSTPIQPIDLMNTEQWTEYFIRGLRNVAPSFSRQEAIDFLTAGIFSQFGYPADVQLSDLRSTDWVDFIFRQGTVTEYDLSFSGGDENTRFFISGGYSVSEGQIKTTGYNEFTLRANFQHDVSEKFTLGLNTVLHNGVSTLTCEDGFFINCPVSQVVLEFPFTYPYDKDGTYNFDLRFGRFSNPAMFFNEQREYSDTFHLLGTLTGNYNFTDWLSLRTQLSIDYRQILEYFYRSPTYLPGIDGVVSTANARVSNLNGSAVLNFRQTFDENHHIAGLAGVELIREYSIEQGAAGIGLPGSLFTVLSAASEPTGVSGENDELRSAGYFGKIKYDYDERYFLSVSGRYDGSSLFGVENRWGFFPAVSVGWRISEEEFFSVDFVDNLLLRAEYGLTGNSLLDDFYAARGLYSVSGSYAGVVGLNPAQLASPQLTWEEALKAGIGLDFSLFNSRITGSINVYQSKRSLLLLSKPLPSTSSYNSILKNLGRVRNRGVEVMLSTVNVAAGDFLWSTNFNISLVDNVVLELTQGVDILNPVSIVPIEEGHSVNDLKMIRFAGVNPVDGRPMWYNADGTLTYNPIFAEDAVYTGEQGDPDIVGGLGNTISYKGLSLSFLFQYSFGQTRQPRTVFFFGQAQIGTTFTNGRVKALTESWRNPGDLVGIPKPWAFAGSSQYPGTDFYSQSSSNSFWNASYVRLKTATLSYSLPTSVTEALNLDGIELFVAGYNLYTWTEYPGYDPEGESAFPESSYPVARRFNGGIEVQF